MELSGHETPRVWGDDEDEAFLRSLVVPEEDRFHAGSSNCFCGFNTLNQNQSPPCFF